MSMTTEIVLKLCEVILIKKPVNMGFFYCEIKL